MLRKILSFLIIFPLVIVPLFCSCVQNVEAATVGVDHDDEGTASTKHDGSKPGHAHSCDCGHAQNAVLENITTSKISFSFVHNSFPGTTFIKPISVLRTPIHIAYLGPPGRAFEIPLYTQQHSLRI